MAVLIPCLMIKNEERFIRQVVEVLLGQFPYILIGDTGSTDKTLCEIPQDPSVRVYHMTPRIPQGLSDVRNFLASEGIRLGGTHVFQIDGDELYTSCGIREVVKWGETIGGQDLVIGFTCLNTVEKTAEGIFYTQDTFNRLAIYPIGIPQTGDYPFDVVRGWDQFPDRFRYISTPEGERYHGFHLHRLPRSSQDEKVFYRERKRLLSSLRDLPMTLGDPVRTWETTSALVS